MSKDNVIKVDGVVTEVLPNTQFKVKINDKHIIHAHISGKMRLNSIRILTGDTVSLEMAQDDLTKGRIVFRKK